MFTALNSGKQLKYIRHCFTRKYYSLKKVKRNFEIIIDENDSQSSNKDKTRQRTDKRIRLIEKVQKDLEDGYNLDEEDNNTITKYILADAKFIESLTKPGKRKNWKDIYNKGKARGMFKSYKSSENLKPFHYPIQR